MHITFMHIDENFEHIESYNFTGSKEGIDHLVYNVNFCNVFSKIYFENSCEWNI